MFKVMFIVHEGTQMSREDALTYWRTKHGEVARKIPNVQSYVQSHAMATPDGSKPPFLGIAEMTFASEATFKEAAGSTEFGAAIADLAKFADANNLPTVIAQDHTIV